MTISPILPRGEAVPEGFTLPHVTTRTMADVWREEDKATRREKRRGSKVRKDGKSKEPRAKRESHDTRASYAGKDNSIYVLRDFDGTYLHQSCEGLTKNVSFAWRGTSRQLDRVRTKFPDLIASEVA